MPLVLFDQPSSVVTARYTGRKMPKILKYFEVNGIAEAIRYILLYTDQKFEDIRYEREDWPIKEVVDAAPFGKLPLLEEDGRVLHQSLAIARYVAAGTDLLPTDPWEQAVLDAAAHTVYDFLKHLVDCVYGTPESTELNRKKMYEEHLPFYFSRFNKQLEENNGYFGGKLSWADFILVGIIECSNLYLKDEIQKDYPKISELVERIRALPRVKEYIKNRKPYKGLEELGEDFLKKFRK